MATEPRRAAHPRGSSLKVLACVVTAACLAGCSSGNSSAGTFVSSVATAGPAADVGRSTAAESASPAATVPLVATGTSSRVTTGAGTAIPSSIPAAAWIATSAIPLNAAFHWTTPASAAKAAKAPVLSAVQDCRLALSGDDKGELAAFPAAQADLSPTSGATGGRDDWTAQETILATNDTSSGDVQGIYVLYTDLVAALGKCAATAPGAKLTAVTAPVPIVVASAVK